MPTNIINNFCFILLSFFSYFIFFSAIAYSGIDEAFPFSGVDEDFPLIESPPLGSPITEQATNMDYESINSTMNHERSNSPCCPLIQEAWWYDYSTLSPPAKCCVYSCVPLCCCVTSSGCIAGTGAIGWGMNFTGKYVESEIFLTAICGVLGYCVSCICIDKKLSPEKERKKVRIKQPVGVPVRLEKILNSDITECGICKESKDELYGHRCSGGTKICDDSIVCKTCIRKWVKKRCTSCRKFLNKWDSPEERKSNHIFTKHSIPSRGNITEDSD